MEKPLILLRKQQEDYFSYRRLSIREPI